MSDRDRDADIRDAVADARDAVAEVRDQSADARDATGDARDPVCRQTSLWTHCLRGPSRGTRKGSCGTGRLSVVTNSQCDAKRLRIVRDPTRNLEGSVIYIGVRPPPGFKQVWTGFMPPRTGTTRRKTDGT